MKKILIITALLGLAICGNAQTVADCNNAQNICSNPNFLFQGISGVGLTGGLTTSNPSTNPQTGNGSNPNATANAGCLATNGPGPQWLVLTVSASGNLGFSFGASGSANPQAGFYDWAMWPFTPSTCTNIFNNTLPPVSCNWNATSVGGTGMGPVPSGGDPGNFQPSLPVTVGQQYLILISNYSGVNTPVSFSNTGTAGLSCGFNSAICAGNSTTVSPIGFVPMTNTSFTLMPGGTTNSTGSFVVTPLVSTIYTIQGMGTNSQNTLVTQTSTTNVTVNPQPVSAVTATQTTCTNTVSSFNLGLTFNPSNATPGYTVTWQPTAPLATLTSSSTSGSGSITPGTYTAVITATGGCTSNAILTINPPPAPSDFTFTSPGSSYTVTCAQPSILLNATQPGYTYTWTNGVIAPMTGTSTSYNSLTLGNWTVTGVNPASNCVSQRTYSIYLNNTAPTVTVAPVNQNITCGPGVVATATATAINPTTNVTHSWYSPGVAIPYTGGGPTSIYNPIVGTNTYVLTNNINGCTTTSYVTVVSSGGNYPTINVTSPQNFTLGCSSKTIAAVTIIGQVPGGGAVSYTLLAPAFTGTNYTPGTTNVYSVTTPGTYTVIVKNNANLCETRVPLSIIQNINPPNIGYSVATQTLSCDVPSLNIVATSTTGGATYNWAFNSTPGNTPAYTVTVRTNTAGASVPSATVIDTYSLTVTDPNNLCISQTTVKMYQNTRPPIPIITGAIPLTCLTNSVNLTNSSTSGILASTFFTTQAVVGYSWSGPPPQQPDTSVSSYQAFTSGTYTLIAKDLNNGCMSQTTAVVGDNRNYPVLQTNTLVPLDCGAANGAGVKLPVTVLGIPANGVTAQWFTPVPTPSVSGLNTLTLTTDGAGDYRIVVMTNSNNCSSLITVKVVPGKLDADFTPDKTTGYAPLTVNFSNNSASTASATATSSITSVWSFGNGTTKTTTNVATTSAVYNQPGTYTVTMFARKGSCIDTVSKVIVVDIPSRLEVPNVFTPNGDNSNDIFFLKTSNLSDINIVIYDRWGNKVYELNTDKGNIAWDGKNQAGKEVADGTYFYVIKATGKDGQTYDEKGNVSLYR